MHSVLLFFIFSYYLQEGGYVIVVSSLSVCLLATLRKNFQKELHEILSEGWQWADEQMIKFWWRSGPGPYDDTGKTCGAMHCPSAFSFLIFLFLVSVL